MPTLARIDHVELLQHVIVKAVPGQRLFEDDTDRDLFLRMLEPLLARTGTKCLAWVLLPDHFHLLLRPTTQRLTTLMLPLLVGYARGFNKRHGRRGRLFRGRYKSVACEDHSVLKELVRYLHLHPLRSGDVAKYKDLERHPWCGHGAIIGSSRLAWQSVGEVLERFGRKRERCLLSYRRFVKAGVGQGERRELAGGGKRRVRRLGVEAHPTRCDGRMLGTSAFVRGIEEAQEWSRAPVRGRAESIFGPRPTVVPVSDLVEKVAAAVGLSPEQVRARSRAPDVRRARRVVCYLAYIRNCHPGRAVAAELGMAHATICAGASAGETLLRYDFRLHHLVR
ncbi:transposase [Geomonas sp. Red32]|uniref:transposase n=1 Tax=Geomonas sp. Red32 TaxID=2912856 RepID=UPI00202CAF17|nr:transposase [Geomonas sp. Red32]MCM0083164.1 transposase [Geomonas sp. Red32]